MRALLTAREMKKCDENTIEHFGVPSCVLMERAALRFVEELEKKGLCDGSVGIVCGTGNNGGDGLAAARLLFLKGRDVRYYLCGDPAKCTKDCRMQYNINRNYQVPEAERFEDLLESGVLVDAIFGIGLSRNIEGEYAHMIEEMNAAKAFRAAVDMPSGISADSGNVMGIAVRCDLTVTFGFGKAGQYLMPGADYCGEIVVTEVGITKESLLGETPECWAMEEGDLSLLEPLDVCRHKGSAGKVLVVAGGPQMAGAAYFASRSAYLMGSGMVKVYTPACNRPTLQTLLPEAVLTDYEDRSQGDLLSLIQWADVILIGPGIGVRPQTKKIVSYVLENAAVPVVCDADCLNIFAQNLQMLRNPHTELILTPHMGEMARLTGESVLYLKDHMREAAAEFSREYQVTCVLKDARTVTCVPFQKTYIQIFGNPGMATAGSGDVLSGIIAGCIAQRVPVSEAAALGVMIHGMAGDMAAAKKGMRSLLATDIMDSIPMVLERRKSDE